jgi:hypothetical protein
MNQHGDTHLDLENCPQCQVAKPLLTQIWFSPPYLYNNDLFDGGWAVYQCSKCRRVILTCAPGYEEIRLIWPKQTILPTEIPDRARKALSEAVKIMGAAPSASIIQSQRAVELMLHAKGVTVGKDVTFNDKIKEAADKQIMIPAMVDWANEIRWAANDERHLNVEDATPDDAQQCVEFALALAQNLFVLPARITRGLDRAKLKSVGIVKASSTGDLQVKQ